ncbi:hypothetical protein Leryth_011789 [Lithospermum erythrorhizon]|nr:hypothetical protein Leryth_011789 [Lithospermum erythrorhizon]
MRTHIGKVKQRIRLGDHIGNRVVGLVHFQCNVGKWNAVAIAALSSQNPGVLAIANAINHINIHIKDDEHNPECPTVKIQAPVLTQ